MDNFLPEELLFEIPVYRVSLDQYQQEYRDIKEESINDLAEKPDWVGRSSDDLKDYVDRWAHMYHSRPYWYNQMIGVIRLYQDGGSIKAEFWGQPHRGFRRDFRHKIYEHQMRVFEYHAGPQPLSSQDIFQILLEELSGLTGRGGALARRHVDLNSFRRIGPHVDWIRVLGWERKNPSPEGA